MCVCSPHTRNLLHMRDAMVDILRQFMGKLHERVPSASRVALLAGKLCLKLHGGQGAQWYQIALMYLEPVRPTFLRMFAHDHCATSSSLQPAMKPGSDHLWWQTCWECLASLDPMMPWLLEFWQFLDTDVGSVVTAGRMPNSPQYQLWSCVARYHAASPAQTYRHVHRIIRWPRGFTGLNQRP